MPVALAAVEQYFPKAQRVLDDRLAARMLPAGARMFVRLLRLRWIRDWIIRKVEESDPGIRGETVLWGLDTDIYVGIYK